MGQERRERGSWWKPGPFCVECGANVRFVLTPLNVLFLLLNVVSGVFAANIIPIRYRCPECGAERITSE